MDTCLLVVAPDTARRERLMRALASDPDFKIVGMGPDVQEAYLSSPEARSADVALLDISAPETARSSFWVTFHIIYPAVKPVALAVRPVNDAALAFALQAGIHSFALWDDTAETLCQAVRSARDGRRFYSAPALLAAAQRVIRDIETGLSQISFHRQGPAEPAARVHLTALEQRVLSYLLRNEGQIVSVGELVREVWKQDHLAGDIANQVNCCVKRLRPKLNADPHNRLHILTVRKQGYRLILKMSEGPDRSPR